MKRALERPSSDDTGSDSDSSGESSGDSKSMSASKTDKAVAKKKGFNVRKFKGAHQYKTKFDVAWLDKHPDCKGMQ